MTRTQQARERLKGNWAQAITVECICISVGMLIPMSSIASLRLLGLNVETVIHASDLYTGGWIYALLTLAFLVMDWLLLSPLLLGKHAFYRQLVLGNEAPFYLIFGFFGRRYFHALRWRLSMFFHRFLTMFIYLTPAAAAAGIAKAVRQSGSQSTAADITLLFCTLLGLFFFFSGLLIGEIRMLRRLPAAYMLIENPEKKYPKRLFKKSAHKMRGHMIEMFNLIAGFTGWFAACIFIIPFLYVIPIFNTTRTIAVSQIVAEEKEYKSFFKRLKSNNNFKTQDTIKLPIPDTKQPC
jgi:uncharacterized membrane protein